jgi:hypothetical protein
MYNVIECWQERATDVRGLVMAATYWLPEQVPTDYVFRVDGFLAMIKSICSSKLANQVRSH